MNPIDVYEVLVKEHEAVVFAYILGLVRDPILAEDIAQEAFVVGFHKLGMLKDKTRFAAWLRAIARNLAYAELKRRHREVPWDDTVATGMEDIFEPFDRSSAGEIWAERVRVLEECVQRLPDKFREVCHWHYYENQSLRDITDRLSLGLDAVKKRLERTRDAIRRCVETRLKLEEP